MTSLFYSRYTPLAASSPTADSARLPVRQQKSQNRSNASSNQTSGAKQQEQDKRSITEAEAVGPSDKVVKDDFEVERPPRKRKKTKDSTVIVDPSPEDRGSKHEKIRSKYEKAVKHSDKTTEQSIILSDDAPAQELDYSVESPPPQTHGLTPIPQPAQRSAGPKVSLSSALPEWLRHPSRVSSAKGIPFVHLPLRRPTLEALEKINFAAALPIQAALLPMLLPTSNQYKGDVCISAATGSGKTLAYALPMVEDLREKLRGLLRGLVVVPTRELVAQARETFELCCRGTDLKIGTAVGNKYLREEQELLIAKGERFEPFVYARQEKAKETVEGKDDLFDINYDPLNLSDDEGGTLPGYVVDYRSIVDILICTPGRLVEHIRSTKGFTLQNVQWFVVDEADRLLDESFQQWVDTVIAELEYLPPSDELETRLNRTFRILRRREVRKILLSATMTRDISKLTALKLSNPKLVVLESGDRSENDALMLDAEADEQSFTLPETLTEIAVPVESASDKPLYLIEILERGVQLPQTWPSRNAKHSQPPNSKYRDQSGDESTSSEDNESTSSSDDDAESSSSSSTSSSRSSTSKPDSPKSNPPITTTTSSPPTHGTLLFTSSTTSATRLTHLLHTLLPSLSPQIHNLTKHTTPKSRRRALSSFHHPSSSSLPHPSLLSPPYHPAPVQRISLPLLITTDRSSRGLSIPRLANVLNYDVPPSLTSYIHRVGRTARAGVVGTAITLLEGQQARWFWNEVARNPGLQRGRASGDGDAGGKKRESKVVRGKVMDMEKWAEGTEARAGYERALGELEGAVKAEGRRRRE